MDAPTRGTGVYFDGISARRQTVTVALAADALVVTAPDGTAIARWPYAEVARMPGVQHRLRLGLVGNGPPARLSIPDPAFAEAVKERLGVLTLQVETQERRKRHRVVEWSIAAVVALILLGFVGLPSVADLLLPLVPIEAEDEMGRQIDHSIRANFSGTGPFECGLADNEKEGHAAFLKIIARLEAAAGLPVRLRPVVVRLPRTVNAQAGAGGYVYLYYGLVRFAETPDELAGVLAHELGHVAHRDTARKLLRKAATAYLFGVILGDFFGSGAMFTSANDVLDARHTQAQEAAADAYSVALMTKAGGDPHAFANFFERLTKLAGDTPKLLSDHPTNAARIAMVMKAPGVPNPTPFLNATEWQALKIVCAGEKKPVAGM